MRIVSRAGLGGSAVAAATTVLYLALIGSEGNDGATEVAPWAAAFAVCAIVGAAASFVEPPRPRSLLFAVAAGTMLGLGFLAIFSIGMLLLLAGGLFAFAAARAVPPGSPREAALGWAVGAAASVAVPVVLVALG